MPVSKPHVFLLKAGNFIRSGVFACSFIGFGWFNLFAQNLDKGQQLFFKGQYKAAIKSLSGDSQTVESIAWLTRAREELGELVKAKNAILQYTKWKSSPQLMNRMGELEFASSNYNRAKEYFATAFQEDSTYLEARLNLGEMAFQWGNRRKGNSLLQYFVERYRATPAPDARLNRLTARACIYLNRFQDANDLFRAASKQAPEDWRIFVRWGNLFLEKYNYADAIKTFKDALKQNPQAITAEIGIAAARKIRDPGEALKISEKLLKNYQNNIRVLNFAAGLYLQIGNLKKAAGLIKQALRIAPDNLQALTLKGKLALYQKRFNQFEKIAARVLAINPAYSRFYTAAGEALSQRYLFVEATQMYRKALTIDSTDAAAHSGLGTTLSRLARLKQAKIELEKAFALDPYNVWTGNLLNLFDSYADYDTIRTQHFVIRLHKKDRPILGPYVAALAESAYTAIVPRYNLKIDFPVTIEIFPKHDDFAVRSFGLPGAQFFLGISFGPLVTMNSPRSRPVGTFSWSETLWHEFAHVVHLTLTRNRIPRWLAEGISVYEATRENAAWGMNRQVAMIGAIRTQSLIPLSELDGGFTGDPRRVTFSYYQSSQIVKFIVDEYGFPSLLDLLNAFRNDQNTARAIKSVLKMNLQDFDEAFLRYLKKEFPYKKIEFDPKLAQLFQRKKASPTLLKKMIEQNPKLYFVKLRYARILLEENEIDQAIAILQQARQSFPEFVGENNPYQLLAKAYLARGDSLKAAQNLLQLLQRNGKNYKVALQLAALAEKLGREDMSEKALEAAIQIYPYNIAVHQKLGDIYLRENKAILAVREFQVMLALNPMDKAGAHCQLAEALLRINKKKEANLHALKALEIAPTYQRAQQILLKTVQ